MSKPSFILTRFTHGSAGKFLSSVLQTSNLVDHWSSMIQDNKSNQEIFNSLMLQYVSRSFPEEHSTYLRSEPMVPYNIDLYSAGYPRGNDVSLGQYINHAHKKQDLRLLNAIDKNLKINLIFHKPRVPMFCNDSAVITITVTSEQEKNWLYKTLWSKHFLESGDTIHYLPSDPDYCNFYSLVPVLTYKNPYCFSKDDKEELYYKYVINDHTNSWYFDPDRFVNFDNKHKLNNLFVELDAILSPSKFLIAVENMFNHLGLTTPNLALIQQMHQIWLSRQVAYEL